MSTPQRILAGAMSGTSADGVDVAIARISGRAIDMQVQLLSCHHHPYDPNLKADIFRVRDGGQISVKQLADMTRQITLDHVKAIASATATTELTAVAAHGQTIYHEPPNTVQLLDPALLACELGCTVISDFRRADCAAGGQGAPLVPFADFLLLRHAHKTRLALNLGGIANITLLRAAGTLQDVIAFDTGPGNCISDWICRTRMPAGAGWDVDGAGAAEGAVIHDIVEQVLKESYFAATAPKSTDGPQMIKMFQQEILTIKPEPSVNDLLATAAYLTAAAIARGIQSLNVRIDEVVASGGGVHNKTIMRWLRSVIDEQIAITPIESCGIPSPAKEAMAFALLGAATLDGVPSNIPAVTGAKRAVVLGSITPKP